MPDYRRPAIFQNVLQFECGCLGLDITDGPGNNLMLQLCHEHNIGFRGGNVPALEWRAMYETERIPAPNHKALDAINQVIRLVQDGKKFRTIQQLLQK